MGKIKSKFLCFFVKDKQTWILFAYADVVIYFNCLKTWLVSPKFLMGLSPLGFTLFFVLQLSMLLALISHLRCALSDPGRTPKIEPSELLVELNNCEYCCQYKPPRTHHCKRCKACIHRMDHHCKWVNNCVGIKNHKFFLLFLLYVICSSIVGLFSIIFSSYLFIKYNGIFIQWQFILVLIAGFECILFMIISGDYLKEQICIIKNNQSTVEKYSRKYGKNFGICNNLKTILGKNILTWLIPISPSLELNYMEPVYNFSEIILKRKQDDNPVAQDYNLI